MEMRDLRAPIEEVLNKYLWHPVTERLLSLMRIEIVEKLKEKKDYYNRNFPGEPILDAHNCCRCGEEFSWMNLQLSFDKIDHSIVEVVCPTCKEKEEK